MSVGFERDPYASQIGVNLGGLEDGNAVPGVAGTDFSVPSNETIQYLASKNFQFFRLCFKWERLQPTLGGPLYAPYLAYITTIVSQAAAVGVKVLLDCHNFGNYNGIPINGPDGPTYAQFANLWSQIAAEFVGNPNILGYDLMNEPQGFAGLTVWPAAAQAAIDAIGAVDPVTPIYVEGYFYASTWAWVANNPTLQNLTSTAGNPLVFSGHEYPDPDGSGTNFNWASSVAIGDVLSSPVGVIDENILVKRYAPFLAWLKQYGLKGHIGETGTSNQDPHWLLTTDNGIASLKSVGVSFTAWCADQFLSPDSYSYGVGQYENGLDSENMAVFTKYSNAYQPSAYQVSGPARGTQFITSSPFTVSYRGYRAEPFTVQLSDGGAGGIFIPSTLTLPAGFNPSATFTYAVPGIDVYQISFENNAGLTDPAPIDFLTATDMFSTEAVSPNNVFALHKIYESYPGACINLRRDSDNATQDFGFVGIHINAPLDVGAIAAWAGSANVFVVKWYDQSPNAWHALPRQAAGVWSGPATNADQPQLILNAQNDLPVVRWTTNGMDCNSPIDGKPGLSVISALNNSTRDTAQLLCWTVAQTYAFPNGGLFSMSNEYAPTMSVGSDGPGVMHSHFGRYKAGVGLAHGVQSFKDGQVVQQADSTQAAIQLQYTSTCNMGWFRYYNGQFFQGDTPFIVIFPGAVSDATIANFQSWAKATYALPNPISQTIPAGPSIDTTNPTSLPAFGVNADGAEFSSGTIPGTSGTDYFIAPRPPAQASYYQSIGLTIMRYPIAWERIQPTLGGALASVYLSQLQAAASAYQAAGVSVIFDLHNFGNYNGNAIGSGGGPTQANFVDLWTKMATAFPPYTYPKVNFDLMNEPVSISHSVGAAAFQAAINAIRTAGFTGYIFVEGSGSYAAADDFNSGGWGPYAAAMTDQYSGSPVAAGAAHYKLVMEVHKYLDSDGSGTHDILTQDGSAALTTCTTYARANNLKLFLGETGWPDTPSGNTQMRAMIHFIMVNMDVWDGVTLWAGGAYPESYYYFTDPASYTAPIISKPQIILFANRATL